MDLLRRADALRVIGERLSLPELKRVSQEPMVSEAWRVTILYHDARSPNSVATLRRGHGAACELQVVYDKLPEPAEFKFPIEIERYREFLMNLRRSRFDKLDDEDDMPFSGADLWLVERAAGSFFHDVVLSPDSAVGNHREIVLAVRQHLAESIREGA